MRLSDTEWRVMNAIWDAPPKTAREVMEATEGETGWAYTTVKTLLTRLVEKGALREDRVGRASAYHPLLDREAARGSALHALLDRAFGGRVGGLVQHLAAGERLSARERAALEALLEDEGKA